MFTLYEEPALSNEENILENMGKWDARQARCGLLAGEGQLCRASAALVVLPLVQPGGRFR